MTVEEVMSELASLGTAQTKKTYLRHGAVEPVFGVRVGDLKTLQKKLRGNQAVAMQLYASKNSDAMYLAGLIADGSKMSKKELNEWAAIATWHMIAGCTVPWVACEHPEGIALAFKWITSKKELVAVAGWSTLSSVVALVPDEKLPIAKLADLLVKVEENIKASPNRVRYAMNGYLISVGTYVAPLAEDALQSAIRIGKIEVDMGDTSCQVPDAASYTLKCRRGANVAPKRKTVRC